MQTDNLRAVCLVVSLSLNFTTRQTAHKLRLTAALYQKYPTHDVRTEAVNEDYEEKSDNFDRTYTWVQRWYKNGYIKMWFHWIQWIVLTSVLISAAMQASNPLGKISIGLAVAVSVVFVYFTGLIGITTLMRNYLGNFIVKGLPHFFIALFGALLASGILLVGFTSAILGLLS